MTGPERERLARAQAALLRAVLAEGPAPAGFDAVRLRALADALRAKRRRVVAGLDPELPARLGDRFAPLFDEYARENPRRDGGTSREDAATFARWLTERDELPQTRRRWWRRRR
jgi:hypothetical protein